MDWWVHSGRKGCDRVWHTQRGAGATLWSRGRAECTFCHPGNHSQAPVDCCTCHCVEKEAVAIVTKWRSILLWSRRNHASLSVFWNNSKLANSKNREEKDLICRKITSKCTQIVVKVTWAYKSIWLTVWSRRNHTGQCINIRRHHYIMLQWPWKTYSADYRVNQKFKSL